MAYYLGLAVLAVLGHARGQLVPQSPCPGIFKYELPGSDPGKWYGVVTLTTDTTLYGIWLNILVDGKADILGNWIGEVTTSDNMDFKIENTTLKLYPDHPLAVRFFIQYNQYGKTPRISTIRLNGREICSAGVRAVFEFTIRPEDIRPVRDEVTTAKSVELRPVKEEVLRSEKPARDERPVYVASEGTGVNTYSIVSGASSQDIGAADKKRPTVTTSTQTRPVDRTETRPSYDQTKPASDSLRPAYDQTRPSAGSSRPGFEESVPSYDQTRPVSDVVRPSYDQTRPVSDVVRPSYDQTRPVSDVVRPSYDQTRPVSDVVRPSYDQTRPVSDVRPSYDQTRPVSDVVRPSYDKTRPVSEVVGSSYDQISSDRDVSRPSYAHERPTTRRPSKRPAVHTTDFQDYSEETISPSENDYFSGGLPSIHAVLSSSPSRPVPASSANSECGRPVHGATPLIVNGRETTEGQWPWQIALYQTQTVDSKYICGGTLISRSHVVTAAHCVTLKGSSHPANKNTFTIYLGKHNLRTSVEGVQIRFIGSIHVHPAYNASSYSRDAAVLGLREPTDYTERVRPVCLWPEQQTDLSYIVGKRGSVVGWGFDEKGLATEELHLVEMPVVDQETCIRSYSEFFARFTSQYTYCAGFRDGRSVCNGDSGGGMVFRIGDSWHLRGLVSLSSARQNDARCDTSHYVIFTDLSKFLPWLRQIISDY